MKIYAISEEIKKYARMVVTQAQNSGLLPKPERCCICGYDRIMLAEEKTRNTVWGFDKKAESNLLDSHHPNYFTPLVVWHLCRKCHKKLHRKQIEHKMAILNIQLAKKLFYA